MATTAIKETVPFDFNTTYSSLEQLFIDKGYVDAAYPGSNTAQLVTAMTYLTSMLNVNTAANINETILTLATKRKNILQDARVLGYEVQHIASYVYTLNVTVPAGNFTIPKYSKFTQGTNTYYYMGDAIQIATADSRTVTFDVKEGVLNTFIDNPVLLTTTTTTVLNEKGQSVDQYYVDIPYQNVEDNGIECFVTYYDAFGILVQSEPWYKSTQFMIDKDTILNKQYVRLDNIESGTPRIYFTLAGVGTGIRLGSIVDINVLISNGINGAMLDVPATDIGITVDSYILKLQGSSEEDSFSIKDNAPAFHNSANRAVTKIDYVSICNRQNTVAYSDVWGGDDEYPKVPGNIWFSFKPSTNIRSFTSDTFNIDYQLDNPEDLVNWYIEDKEIQSTTTDVNGNLTNPGVFDVLQQYKIPTLVFNHRHVIYMDFHYEIQIMKYSISISKADINQNAFNIINKYFFDSTTPITSNIESFLFEYFNTNLEKRIDQGLSDITGFTNVLTTKLMLTSKTISSESAKTGTYNFANKDIYIHLAVPYENYFINDDLDSTKLPKIDTLLFDGTNDLIVDFTGLTTNARLLEIIEAPVKLNNIQVGRYLIFNSFVKYIVVQLYIQDNTTSSVPTGVYTTGIDSTVFDTVKYLDLKYPSNNFALKRNVLPRLRSVKFI